MPVVLGGSYRYSFLTDRSRVIWPISGRKPGTYLANSLIPLYESPTTTHF